MTPEGTRTTVDISGFKKYLPAYEEVCQRMLYLGLQQLPEIPADEFERLRQYRRVFGYVDTSQCHQLRRLEEVWTQDPNIQDHGGVTGAMVHAVLGHLALVKTLGYESWLEQFPEKRRYDLVDPFVCTAPLPTPEESFEAGRRVAMEWRGDMPQES